MARTFAVDVLAYPTCQGRMRLLALVGRLAWRQARTDRAHPPAVAQRFRLLTDEHFPNSIIELLRKAE